jgi:hypothetical protein
MQDVMSEFEKMFDPETVFYITAGVWLILGLCSGLFLYFCKDAELNIKILSVSAISAATLFVVFMLFGSVPRQIYNFIVPVVTVVFAVVLSQRET